uniref:Uncharacterized protein n=1 Tax=Anguilla anguilla TaxID=7936 RepID=A0A0E9SQ59_ANGAN
MSIGYYYDATSTRSISPRY